MSTCDCLEAEGCKPSSHHPANLPSPGSQGAVLPCHGLAVRCCRKLHAGRLIAPCRRRCRRRCCCTGVALLPLATAAACHPLNHARFLLPCSRIRSLLSKNNNTAPLARRPYVSYMVGEGVCKLCANEWGLLAQRPAE